MDKGKLLYGLMKDPHRCWRIVRIGRVGLI